MQVVMVIRSNLSNGGIGSTPEETVIWGTPQMRGLSGIYNKRGVRGSTTSERGDTGTQVRGVSGGTQ